MFRSIRWRIAFWYVLLITIALVSSSVLYASLIRQTYVEDLEQELVAEARLLATQLQPFLQLPTDLTQFNDLSRQFADLAGKRVTIIGADGTVLGESHDDLSRMDNHLNRPEIQQALSVGAGTSTRFSSTLATTIW